MLAVGSVDGRVRLIDARTGDVGLDLRDAHMSSAFCVALSADGSTLTSVGEYPP